MAVSKQSIGFQMSFFVEFRILRHWVSVNNNNMQNRYCSYKYCRVWFCGLLMFLLHFTIKADMFSQDAGIMFLWWLAMPCFHCVVASLFDFCNFSIASSLRIYCIKSLEFQFSMIDIFRFWGCCHSEKAKRPNTWRGLS